MCLIGGNGGKCIGDHPCCQAAAGLCLCPHFKGCAVVPEEKSGTGAGADAQRRKWISRFLRRHPAHCGAAHPADRHG